MGLVGRQYRANETAEGPEPIDPVHHGHFVGRPLSGTSSRSVSYDTAASPGTTPILTPDLAWGNTPGYFSIPSAGKAMSRTKSHDYTRRAVSNPIRERPKSVSLR